MASGIVCEVDAARGGYSIEPDGGGPSISACREALVSTAPRELEVGERVVFDVLAGCVGLHAENVRPADLRPTRPVRARTVPLPAAA